MSASTKASTKATSTTPANVVTVRSAYRVERAKEVAALRVVGAFARIVGNAELGSAHRALIKQTYRPGGSVVRWAQPEHRTVHGKDTPDNGTTLAAFAGYVAGLLGTAPAKGEPGHEEHAAAKAALAAFAKAAK